MKGGSIISTSQQRPKRLMTVTIAMATCSLLKYHACKEVTHGRSTVAAESILTTMVFYPPNFYIMPMVVVQYNFVFICCLLLMVAFSIFATQTKRLCGCMLLTVAYISRLGCQDNRLQEAFTSSC